MIIPPIAFPSFTILISSLSSTPLPTTAATDCRKCAWNWGYNLIRLFRAKLSVRRDMWKKWVKDTVLSLCCHQQLVSSVFGSASQIRKTGFNKDSGNRSAAESGRASGNPFADPFEDGGILVGYSVRIDDPKFVDEKLLDFLEWTSAFYHRHRLCSEATGIVRDRCRFVNHEQRRRVIYEVVDDSLRNFAKIPFATQLFEGLMAWVDGSLIQLDIEGGKW